jgi:glycosyltransferase involved in cell wall biosynthesis
MNGQINALSSNCGLDAVTPVVQGGPLAGRTVLRFAHAFDSDGGTERYLDDLDRILLERNAMTIIRLHLTREALRVQPEVASIGQGKLIRIRLPVAEESGARSSTETSVVRLQIKQKLRDLVLYNPLVWRTIGSKWAASFQPRQKPGEAVGAGIAFAEIMRAHHIDMAMLHFFGGADAEEIVTAARENHIPFTVLNHYSNDRFLHLAMRKHAMLADGVAGVNGLQVPRYLERRFVKLSDGIDTKFFSRAEARTIPDMPAEPIVLLPARVIREKGQLDLVRAAASLRDLGVKCSIVFAGRVGTQEFLNELRNEASRAGLTDSTRFLGAVSVEALRDWYAASSLVAFPTYHHEGLPRVIIESQAMGTPVVAYATGGVPDAIVTGTTGLLVPTGDITGLTKRLCELLSSKELRLSIAARGRQAAEQNFSLDALAERHEAFYLRIIANAGRVADRKNA